MTPPSTGSATPLTCPESGEQSQNTAAAMSSGSAIRPCGRFSPVSQSGFASVNAASIGVATRPGHTALTRIPSAAYSTATDRVSPMTPNLLAA
jgi:hypothetical protein